MKQLTKEQHEAILEFLDSIECGVSGTYKGEIFKLANVNDVKSLFVEKFPPSCCDSCADGETCESEPLISEGTACFESLERAKYKHVVNFDMSNITDLTWEQSTKLSELLSLGKIILTNKEGKQYLINTEDVKPADVTISKEPKIVFTETYAETEAKAQKWVKAYNEIHTQQP